MVTRYPSLLRPPLGLGRLPPGGSPQTALGTAEASAEMLAKGATGLVADLRLTRDGHAVVHHDSTVRLGWHRRPLAELARSQLPDTVVAVDELYQACGTARWHLALTVHHDDDAAVAVALARRSGGEAEGNLWLYAGDWRQAARWRSLSDDIHLVERTRLRRVQTGPERRAAVLANAGVDAIELPEGDWSPGLTTLFHRFNRLALAGLASHRRQLDALLAMGLDVVTSDHVERMVEALAALDDPGGP